ncbi:ATP-binding protein [Catenuloplanes atrovinosus]|uniref:Anti-sigma regulatory factor (Ser/Thr protein kinase) n=1 Tax=Catenuloplanes atrovinosus TaxID=137266 RepID=A0AAE3YVP9_9ACTN|nr:ATP-binding protein [Catenuloplanes atrovinosus]MDR7279243.1 anti-sigma regulatory factor (Ser/Thr protein kinase) [Catenuloplanes atrovinosus]
MTGHILLLYDDGEELAARVAAAVAGTDDPLVLALRPEHHAAVAAALGDRPMIQAARPDVHTRPAAALAGYYRFTRHAPRVTVIAEPDPGATADARARAARFEAAADLTIPGSGLTVVCAYPAATPDLLRTHPHLLTPVGTAGNPGHADASALLHDLGPAHPAAPPAAAPRLRICGSTTIRDLDAVRRRVTEHLADLAPLVRADFVAAVNEILTNAYLHGAPPLGLTLWADPDTVECRVTDHGPGRPDPTLGYRPRPNAGRAGAGLWLARQACDDLDMWRTDDTFTVRLSSTTRHHSHPHSGALARAETAHTRTALLSRRVAGLRHR